MTRRPRLDAWLAESAAVLDEVFPPEQCDTDVQLHGLQWLPSHGQHTHTIAPDDTPLSPVERQAGDGDSAVPSPATQHPYLTALKRIAMERAKKTAKRHRYGEGL